MPVNEFLGILAKILLAVWGSTQIALWMLWLWREASNENMVNGEHFSAGEAARGFMTLGLMLGMVVTGIGALWAWVIL
jgi:hypothetical protein